jgi:hypothetical protein
MGSTLEDITHIYTSDNRKHLIVLSHPEIYLRLPFIKYELQRCAVLLRTYQSSNRAVKKIRRLLFEKLFLIICRSVANKTVAHYLNDKLQEIHVIYIIDEKNDNDDDNDISAVFENLKQNLSETGCCNSVSSSTESLQSDTNALTVAIYHSDSISKEKISFLWNQLLINVILRLMRPSEREITETISRFIELYSNDIVATREIINFSREYSSASTAWWCNKTPYIYSLFNNAFRMRNVDAIFDLRFLIMDLHHHLALSYRNQTQMRALTPVVHRYFNPSDLIDADAFVRNVGEILSFHNPFSTTDLVNSRISNNKNDIVIEIVNLDTANEAAMPFAFASSSSITNDERETLFFWNSLFRILSVKKLETSRWSVELQLVTKEELRQTLDDIARPFAGTLRDPIRLLTRGRELENNNETEKAVMYYKKLFKITLFNDQDRVIEMYEQLDRLIKECKYIIFYLS